MAGQLIGPLCVASGVVAIGMGWLVARSRLKRAKRVHRKRALVHAAMPEGWGVWFFQGFSDVTFGTRWVVAVVVLAACTVLGVGLVSLGLHLAR